jgi:hypothetical protein
MRHYLLTMLLGISLTWSFGAQSGTILTGGGRAAVTQGPGDGIAHPYTREVSVLAGMVRSVGSIPGDNTVIRLQFVRPDARAVAFVAISFPRHYGSGGTFDETTPEVSIVYYEQSPENPRDKRFVAYSWEGTVRIVSLGTGALLRAGMDLVFLDPGPDGQEGSEDDYWRRLQADGIQIEEKGDLTNATYYHDGYYVRNSSDVIVVYDDGCSRNTDRYDDYDDGYYGGSSSSGWGDSSCEGDTYDDSDDSDGSCSSDDWDDDDWDDDDWDDDDWGGSSGSGGWEGDDWEDDEEPSTLRVTTMSWLSPLAKPASRVFRGKNSRLIPLVLCVLLLLGCRTISPSFVASRRRP